ncbi:putative aspartic peptidase A1 family, aspartic peptidase domain superfamily, xylanase inhibitor [Helianthus anomalus]
MILCVLGFIIQKSSLVLLQRTIIYKLTHEVMCYGLVVHLVMAIPMEFYDPSSSSTSHAISCADQQCSRAVESSYSGCLNGQCTYKSKYGDETIVEGSRELSSSANVVFGTTQMGDLTKSD